MSDKPHDLIVNIEERPVFGKHSGLLSYAVHLTYTDENNWDWTGFGLLEEVRDAKGRHSYLVTSLDDAYPGRPIIAAALTALFRSDIADREVMETIGEKIIADIRARKEEAAEYRAEARRELAMQDA